MKKIKMRVLAFLLTLCMVLVPNAPLLAQAEQSQAETAVEGTAEQTEQEEAVPAAQENQQPTAGAALNGVATVGTFEELQAALQDDSVSKIIIIKDITLSQTLGVSRSVELKAESGRATLFTMGSGRHFHLLPEAKLLGLDGIILDGNDLGGGLYAEGEQIEIRGGTIQHCRAKNGGAIEGKDLVTNVKVKDTILQDNQAIEKGGGIFANNILIEPDSVMRRNRARDGGAAYARAETMDGGILENNIATQKGGAVYAPVFKLHNGVLKNNQAEQGGAVYTVTCELYGGELFGNAAQDGGAIFATHFYMSAESSAKIYDNSAAQDGGGVYAIGPVTLNNGELIGNVAGRNGGGIHVSSLNLLNVGAAFTFAKNKAATGYEIAEEDKALHQALIQTRKFTAPFEYGYNNYDIGYTAGTPTVTSIVVSYEANGGLGERVQREVQPGGYVVESPEQLGFFRPGYVFAGWSIEPEGAPAYFPGNEIDLQQSMTLYAIWEIGLCTVDFDTMGGWGMVPSVQVHYGETVPAPMTPIKPGYAFQGWYTQPEGGAFWDFAADVVTQDMTLYARWTINQYQVRFDAQGGTPVPPAQTVAYGGLISQPEDPAKEGYRFVGWGVLEGENWQQWDFAADTMPLGDLVLSARWEQRERFTLTYDANGGVGTTSEQVYDGVSYPLKDAGTLGISRYRNVFFGWTSDPASETIEYRPGDQIVPTGDVTLYAVWKSPYFGNPTELQKALEEPSFDTIYAYADFTMSGAVVINRDVNIVGEEAASFTLTAANGQRHFTLGQNDILVRFARVTLRGAGNGGGIQNDGQNNTIVGVNIHGARRGQGGALYSTGSLTLINATLQGNSATRGGAIYTTAPLTLRGSDADGVNYDDGDRNQTFLMQNNSAQYGGGIFVDGSQLDLWGDTRIQNNQASQDGGGLYSVNGTLNTNENTLFASNTAYRGGAVFSINGSHSIQGNTTFRENSGDDHGAFLLDGGSVVTGGNTLFIGNSAVHHGAGMSLTWNASGVFGGTTKFTENRARAGAGVFVSHGSKLEMLDQAQIVSNTADGGGGIYAEYDSEIVLRDQAKLNQNIRGGAVALLDSALWSYDNVEMRGNTSVSGAAIYALRSKVHTHGSTTFRENTADSAGAILLTEGSYLETGDDTVFVDNSAVHHGGSVAFAWNSTGVIGGNTKLSENRARAGGGVFVSHGSKLEVVDQAQIVSNTAEGGGGIYTEHDSEILLRGRAKLNQNVADSPNTYDGARWGGAVALNDSTLKSYDDVEMVGNVAYNGAAISARTSKVYTYGNTTFKDNAGDITGSVLVIDGSHIETHDDTLFEANTVVHHGGGVAVTRDSFAKIADRTKFVGNSCRVGGSIYAATGSNVEVGGEVEMISNTADTGGAMYIEQNSQASLSGRVKIKNNKAIWRGGTIDSGWGGGVAVLFDSTLRTYDEVEIAENSAVSGGGLYLQNKCSAYIYGDTTIRDNIGDITGAVYVNGNSLIQTHDRTAFLNNTATHHGAGVVIAQGSTGRFTNQTAFTGNRSRAGGALFASENATVELADEVRMLHNTAEYGGAIYAEHASGIAMTGNAALANNQSTNWQFGGAGVNLNQNCSLTMSGNTNIIGNHSNAFGGGIFNNGGQVLLRGNAKVHHNSSSQNFGGIFTAHGSGLTILEQASVLYNTPNDRN